MNIYRQPGNYIEVEPGVEIYYEEKGTGTPIVFVPGWTFTTEVFVHQIEHFSKTHRVIAIDPRSQGRSSITLHGNDYTTHAADLAKIIKALDLQDVVLVGWSFGCLETWGYVKQEGTKALQAMVCIDLSPSNSRFGVVYQPSALHISPSGGIQREPAVQECRKRDCRLAF